MASSVQAQKVGLRAMVAQLRSSGLLQDRRRGQWIYYRLHPQLADWAQQVVQLACAADNPKFNDDLARLMVMGNRPERQACCA